jgi:hypothetical protein
MDKPLTAEDVAREYGEEFLRELVAELAAAPQSAHSSVVLSVPPNVYRKNMRGGIWVSKFHHLKANPLPRRKPIPPGADQWPVRLAPWQEELLVLWWRADLNETALTALVEAHRPMVVSMARKLSRWHFGLLTEYGMLGLRVAAGPQRPSKTKKGKLAGFDPAKARFNTYARSVALRFMTAAVLAMRGVRIMKPLRMVTDAIVIYGDLFSECVGPRFEDSVEEFARWAKTPVPIAVERRALAQPSDDARWSRKAKALALPHSLGCCTVNYDKFRLSAVPDFANHQQRPRQDIFI